MKHLTLALTLALTTILMAGCACKPPLVERPICIVQPRVPYTDPPPVWWVEQMAAYYKSVEERNLLYKEAHDLNVKVKIHNTKIRDIVAELNETVDQLNNLTEESE